MEKEYFDIDSLPKDPVTIKFNKPNLRQFVVTRSYFDEHGWKEEHIFTSDSFKEAVKKASESMETSSNKEWKQILVYEADGETLVCRFFETDIVNLYRLRQYLK